MSRGRDWEIGEIGDAAVVGRTLPRIGLRPRRHRSRVGHRLAKVGDRVEAQDLAALSGPRRAVSSGFSVTPTFPSPLMTVCAWSGFAVMPAALPWRPIGSRCSPTAACSIASNAAGATAPATSFSSPWTSLPGSLRLCLPLASTWFAITRCRHPRPAGERCWFLPGRKPTSRSLTPDVTSAGRLVIPAPKVQSRRATAAPATTPGLSFCAACSRLTC